MVWMLARPAYQTDADELAAACSPGQTFDGGGRARLRVRDRLLPVQQTTKDTLKVIFHLLQRRKNKP